MLSPQVKKVILASLDRVASVDVLRQLRWELGLRASAVRGALRPSQRRVLRQIRAEGRRDLRVNLGCGPLPAKGWLNVDGVSAQADVIQVLGQPLALPSGCASLVFSEHVLEHLDYPRSARTFLREANRILRESGLIRLIVPDAERVLRAYAADDSRVLSTLVPDERTPIEAVNKLFREFGFHRFAWDFDLLRRELELAGFGQVRRAAFRDSADSALNLDLEEPGRIAESLYVEAIKVGDGSVR